MRNIFLLIACFFNSYHLCSQALNKERPGQSKKFYVTGKINEISDGEKLALFRYRDGSIDEASTDTIHNGSFTLSDTASRPVLYWILGRNNRFPNLPLEIWAAPGITIHVSGKGYLLKTWNVISDLPEQQEENRYLMPSIADWNRIQEMRIEKESIRQKMQQISGKEVEPLKSKNDSLSSRTDAVMANIDQTQIRLLQKSPVTTIWLNKMFDLSFKANLNPQIKNRASILQLHKRMTTTQQKSSIGEKIAANLFPLAVIKTGDTMADKALLDTQMMQHNLSEYTGKGKYLLLDFWFVWCGPCHMALPETKALSDSLADKLTIVGVNVDETDYWKEASKHENISWVNLNDPLGRYGLAGRYGPLSTFGYPHYVLISPEGIVLQSWEGYEKGSLIQKVHQYIH